MVVLREWLACDKRDKITEVLGIGVSSPPNATSAEFMFHQFHLDKSNCIGVPDLKEILSISYYHVVRGSYIFWVSFIYYCVIICTQQLVRFLIRRLFSLHAKSS